MSLIFRKIAGLCPKMLIMAIAIIMLTVSAHAADLERFIREDYRGNLFHQTTPQAALAIRDNGFRFPQGGGNIDSYALGLGVYFCENQRDCQRLALHGGRTIRTEIRLGRYLEIRGGDYNSIHRRLSGGWQRFRGQLDRIRVDGVIWRDKTDGSPDEIVVYNPDCIRNTHIVRP